MRNDANNFTKWKQSKEKEIIKLTTQYHKCAYEMVRMKIQHNKQENVFKRKMEEAFAVNKRLKVCFFADNRRIPFVSIISFLLFIKCYKQGQIMRC